MYRPLLYCIELEREGSTASESEIRSLTFEQALWYECQSERIVFFARLRSWRSLQFARSVAIGSIKRVESKVCGIFVSGANLKVRLCGFNEPAITGFGRTSVNGSGTKWPILAIQTAK